MYESEEIAKRKFSDWDGFSLICPTDDSGAILELKGTKADMLSSTPMMRIRRCKGKPSCKSDAEINEFIRDI